MNTEKPLQGMIASPAALGEEASRRGTTPRQPQAIAPRRRPSRTAAALAAVLAAALGIVAPAVSSAQDTATGAVVVPGPEPDPLGRSGPTLATKPIVDRLQIDLGYTYDDNVTRGRVADEILADQFFGLNLRAGLTFPLTRNTRAIITGLVDGEAFQTYNGLNHLSGGLQAEVQYRTSAAFDAVTFAAFLRGWVDNYDSQLRDGSRYSVGVSARGAITDRLDFYAEVARHQRHAQSAVWDLTDYAARLNLDYSLGRRGTLYLNGEYQRGDTVSDGVASLVNVALAQVFVLDDAFPGDRLFAYRFDARTWIGTLGYNLPLGPRESIDISWRRVQTTPTERPDFDVQGSLRYIDNQYSIVFLKLF